MWFVVRFLTGIFLFPVVAIAQSIHELLGSLDVVRIDDESDHRFDKFQSEVFGNPNAQIDLFVSYSSKYSNEVRWIVEQLIGARLNVWFAEYEINLQNRKSFQSEIDKAIAKSQYFVFFFDDWYNESKFCRHELELARSLHDKSTDKLIEIYRLKRCIYDGKKLTQNSIKSTFQFKGLKHRSEVAKGILEIISPSTELIIPYPKRSVRTEFIYVVSTYEIGMTLFDWVCISEGSFRSLGRFTIPTIFRKESSLGQIELQIGGQDKGPFTDIPNMSDRERMEAAIERAAAYYRKDRSLCVGVHKFSFQNRGHFAFTVKQRRRYWKREYFIANFAREHGHPTHFYLKFTFVGGFRSFCHAASEMDEIVGSLKIRKVDDIQSRIEELERCRIHRL